MTRHELREHIFLLVFRSAFHDYEEMPEQVRLYLENLEEPAGDDDAQYILDKSSAVFAHLSELDKKIEEKAENWTIDRMGKVELSAIRLALYEILFDDDVPTGVAIDEAVEIAKSYGQDNSGAFVNGVLAKLVKEQG